MRGHQIAVLGGHPFSVLVGHQNSLMYCPSRVFSKMSVVRKGNTGRFWVCKSCGVGKFNQWFAYMTHRRLCTIDTASSSLTIADHAANDDVSVLPVHQEVVNEFVVDDEVIVHNDANEDENDDNDIVGDDDEINDERLEFSEDIALYVNERETLRYRTKFMKWGLAGPGGETMNGKASSYNAAQVVTLRFLQTLETGDSLSLQRQQGILDNA